jgi:hypothetical protein
MVSSTGKDVNQMGDFQYCVTQKEFEYITITLRAGFFPAARIGICNPKKWSNLNDMRSIMDLVKNAIPSELQDTKLKLPSTIKWGENIPIQGGFLSESNGLDVSLEVVSELNAKKAGPGTWIFLAVTLTMVGFGILGIAVQYTKLGDINNVSQEEKTLIEKRKNKIAMFFYCFNPILNLNKLFTVKEGGDESLAVLNGVRVLSILWVALGHAFSFFSFGPVHNYQLAETTVLKSHTSGMIAGGLYAVDTFFFLAGFLTWYLVTIKAYARKGNINWVLVYFHRYYRLIFPIVFITFFAMYGYSFFADGPLYRDVANIMIDPCEKYWWTNFLFINNFHPFDNGKECIGWVWYLANDFQFFLMTPPIIYAFCKNRRIGYMIWLFLIIASMIVNGTLTAIYDVSVLWGDAKNDFKTGNWMYGKPWSRMGAYFVGAIFGFGFFEHSCKQKFPELAGTLMDSIYVRVKHSRSISIAMCVVGIGITALYVFPLRSYMIEWNQGVNWWSTTVSVLYNMTVRQFFTFGLGLILMPTFVGRLRIIKSFLGSEPFAIMARLNYMVYMLHCLVIFWYITDLRQSIYANELNLWFYSFGVFIVSFLLAIPFTLLYEAPFLNIEKYLLFPAPQRNKEIREKGPVNNSKDTRYFPLIEDNNTKESDRTDKE